MEAMKSKGIEIKAPHTISIKHSIFLAGSIEMGSATDWQKKASQLLIEAGWNILNPRRDDWNNSWIQSIDNPQFFEQVSWELSALEHADIIILHLEANTKSPISLLELGLFANSKKLYVSCDKNFWRRGNVEIVCNRYNIPFFNSVNDTINSIIKL